MTNYLHKSLILAAAVLAGINAYAYDFTVGGVYYSITSADDKTVAVAASPSDALYSGAVNIPATVVNGGVTYKVTSLEQGSFTGCADVTSVAFADSEDAITSGGTTSTNMRIFADCTKLDSVYVGRDFKYNTSNAASPFSKNTSITKVVVGNKVIKINNNMFSGCSGLKDVDFGKTVKTISDYAFSQCSKLDTISLPESVVQLTKYAFSNSGLKNVTLPNSVVSMGEGVFQNCKSLVSLKLSENLKTLPARMVAMCSSLESVEIPSGVTTIGFYAFYDCTKLESLALPESVTSLGTDVLNGCTNLSSLTLSPNLEELPSNMAKGCTKLTSVIIPEKVKTIGFGSLWKTSITSTDIPDNITTIKGYAYADNANLATVKIGKSVSQIDQRAFLNCTGITEISALNPKPATVGIYVFDTSLYTKTKLYVPKGSLDAYKAASTWKEFTLIEEKDFSGVEDNVAAESVKVVAQNGEISVIGADENATVEVYNINGQLIYSGAADVAVSAAKGFYVVKVAGKAVKVAL